MAAGPISERNQDATIYVGGLDEKVTESLLWELFVQVGTPVLYSALQCWSHQISRPGWARGQRPHAERPSHDAAPGLRVCGVPK